MSEPCPRTKEYLALLAADAGPDDPRWQHVGDCDACARALSRALLDAEAPDEDDIALAAAGLADVDTARRVERARGLDPEVAERWSQSVGEPESNAARARSWTWALAASALLALGLSAALLSRESDPSPDHRLIARGPAAEAEIELVLGDDSVCRTMIDGSPPCRWRTAAEPLTVHYRSPGVVYAAVLIHDADGDWTVLHPDGGGAAETAACTERFCLLTGGEYDVPRGATRVVVLLFDTPPPTGSIVAGPLRGDLSAAIHRFDLLAE